MGKAKTRADTRIRLFEARDENHPRNATYEGIERFSGLEKERKKTDPFFIGFFTVPHFLVLGFFYFVWTTSDINRLDHAADFRGDLCGKPGTTVENLPYAYYFDPAGTPDIAMCVSNCPATNGDEICFYDVDGSTVMDDYCYQTISTKAVNIYCIPMTIGGNRTLVESYAYKDIEFYKRVSSSLYWAVDLTGISLFVMLLIGLIYNAFIVHNKTRNGMFKFTLILTGVFAGAYMYSITLDIDRHLQKQCQTPGVDDGCGGSRVQFDNLLLYSVGGVLAIFYIYLFLHRHNIRFLLRNVRVLLRPLRQLKKTYLLIILVFTVQVLVIEAFIFLFIIVTVTGKIKIVPAPDAFPNSTYGAIVQDQIYSNFIYVAIGLLIWWLGVIQLFTRMIICAIASNWYFAREKTILDDPIISGFKFSLKYHVGSIILSSMLIIVLWPINTILAYARKKLPKLNKKSRKFRFWMNTCTPFLIFYEEITKYVSHKNLYQVIVFGEEFYNAGVRSFYLRYRNNSRLENIKKMIGYFNIIGKTCCTFGGAAFLNLFIHYKGTTTWGKEFDLMEYPIAPSVIILFIGFLASQTITSVIDITCESLMYCFICDEEMYAGKQRFVDDEMRQLMDLHGTEAKNVNDLEIHARPKMNDEVFHEEDAPVINIPEPEIEDEFHDDDKEEEQKKDDTPPEFAPVNVQLDELDFSDHPEPQQDTERTERTQPKQFNEVQMDDFFSPNTQKSKEEPALKINIPDFKNNESALFHGGSERDDAQDDKKKTIVKPFSETSGLDILGTSKSDFKQLDDSRAGDINKQVFNGSKLQLEAVESNSEDEEDLDVNTGRKDITKGRDNFVF